MNLQRFMTNLLFLVLLVATTAQGCDRVIVSGATLGQVDKMGLYVKQAGQENSGKPVFKYLSYYLYYYNNVYWVIGSTVGSSSISLYVTSSASSPELIDASSTWKVYNGNAFVFDSGVQASCHTLSAEMQAVFDNANTCSSPCRFIFTQDTDW